MAYTIANVVKPTALDNNGGTKKFFYIADVTEFTTLQSFMTYSAAGDEVIISGNHVMATNKAFAKVYITEDSGEVMAETIGSRDGRSKKFTFKGFHPGTSAVFAEFERNWKAKDAIVLIPLANGTYIQGGAAGEECEVVASWKSNKRSGDGAGFDIEISWFGNSLAIYTGTIDNSFV